MTLADLVIISAVLLFSFFGYRRGAIRQLADFFSLILSILISVIFYSSFAEYLSQQTALSPGITKVIAFFTLWILTQLIFNLIFYIIYSFVPSRVRRSKINKAIGTLPGLLWGVVFISLVIMIIAVLPFSSPYRDALVESSSGKYIIGKTTGLERHVSDILGGVLDETLTFRTVHPDSDQTADLGFSVPVDKISIDEESEKRMLELVNRERSLRGLGELRMDQDLVRLSRAHSKDMFERNYFAHVNPDGKDPFDRMRDFGINFRVAGENLALAPSVNLAHEGLMNSPGHRANILTAEFGLVGIGCIDGGSHGKMFTQSFTN